MKTPVIIPALDEERYIGATLAALPADLVEPIVAVNGSTDKTAEIAQQFGAKVICFEEQGKLPAIQRVLKLLGEQALEPMIILDADTRPLVPRSWHRIMSRCLRVANSPTPVVVGGPLWFEGGDKINTTLRSLFVIPRNQSARMRDPSSIGQAGPNMGVAIKSPQVLEEILELPHYWPGEDRAIVNVIRSHGGHYLQPIHPLLSTITRLPPSFTSLRERLRISLEESERRSIEYKVRTAAPGSQPFLL